ATNLDPFFLAPDALRALFCRSLQRADREQGGELLALLEGNRGLFDGLDVEGSCSTAELARILGCPIVLSLNCTKMTRTAAALIQGVMRFEPGLVFAGVVLNQVGSVRHERLLRRVLEAHTDMPVLGALPRLAENPLPERHMGIASSGCSLAADAAARLESLADQVRQHIDLDAVLAAAHAAPDMAIPDSLPDSLSCSPASPPASSLSSSQSDTLSLSAEAPAGNGIWLTSPDMQPAHSPTVAPRPRIGYVRDAALWFYYEDNLAALEDAGAALVRLRIIGEGADSPEAAACWESLDGLYLGGGFPEDCAPALSRSPRLAQRARLAGRGLLVYAECGGFMLLAQGIERDAVVWPMSGIFPVTACFSPKPQGLGYVAGTVQQETPFFPVGLELRGHEFHYSHCRWQGAPPPGALRLRRGQGMGRMGQCGPSERADGLVRGRVWAAYTHIFAPAVPCWAPNFVAVAGRYRQEREARCVFR
ncbi:MAG: cobyrinate a,c-diamide synthase, partial [Desulfovibrionaceae bacterium]|nr:cobyrinate a,c-diamide synthase [Desulfovibrionaceae bacterium]